MKNFNSVNDRYFDWLPKSKTVFELQKNVLTSFNLGELTPLGFFEGLPGDTFNFNAQSLFRITSPLTKSAFETLDVHYAVFSVPLRLLYENFKKVMGERDDYDTKSDTDYKIPLIDFTGSDGKEIPNYVKSILSYFGVPIPSENDINRGAKLRNINKMLSNAYAMIYNDHFRDQNLQQAKDIDISDNNIQFIGESDPNSDFHNSPPDKYTGKLAHVNRNFDYFSNVFTDTQKGEKVILSLAGDAPVVNTGIIGGSSSPSFYKLNGDLPVSGNVSIAGTHLTDASNNDLKFGSNTSLLIDPNIKADLSDISAFDMNQLREVSKLQKRKELDLVAGTRYYEIVENYFDIKNVLGKLDYPEYIAYSQGHVEISQVVQTSGTSPTDTTKQGNIAGYGVEGNNHGNVNVTLREHSLIIPLMYVTQRHRYQQGVHKFFNRRDKLDFFDPLQIGNGFQPIYKSEIYGYLTDSEKDDVWAQAPNAERYRKETDLITGQLNVNAKDSISTWHAGDVYSAPPTFDKDWKIETSKFFDNCLVFGSNIVDNFLVNVNFSGLKISAVDPLGVPHI